MSDDFEGVNEVAGKGKRGCSRMPRDWSRGK